MLTELRAENYKSFRSATSIPIRQITVLLGKNNSGKTAAARLPLLLLSAIGSPGSPNIPLALQVRGLVFGSSLLELTYGQLPHAPFKLGTTLQSERAEPTHIDFAIHHAQSLRGGQSAFISEFSAPPFIHTIQWLPSKDTLKTGDIKYDDPEVAMFRGVLPILQGERSRTVSFIEEMAERQFRNLVHLRSMRAQAQAIYENRPPADLTDSTGGEAPYLLNADYTLQDRVANWYSNRLNLPGLTLESGGSAFSIVFRSPTDEGPNLARVGQGVQQVLPVATYLIGMAYGLLTPKFVTIEEPELHLHPAAHGALADLMIAAAIGNPSNQIMIETHSENLVLRLRRAVAEGTLKPEQIGILWFDHSSSKGTTVRPIEVATDGSVSSWPRGVFAEDLEEVQGIIRAGRK